MVGRRAAWLLAAGVVCVLVLMVGAPVAGAQTFQLGSCSASDLSAAVATANTNGQDDTIFLKQGCTYTLSSQLVVSPDGGHTLSVFGYGNATISGGGKSGIFTVQQGANLTVRRLTLTDALCGGSVGCGPIEAEGATVTVVGSSITNNPAGSDGVLASSSIITVANSSISDNADGIGIASTDGAVTVSSSTISDNNGPGLSNLRGTMTVIATTVSGNHAYDAGGGIDNYGGYLRVYASTIANNAASNTGGGGIANEYSNASAWIADSTIAGNSSDIEGGGIDNQGQVTLLWSTLSGNTAPQQKGGDVYLQPQSALLLEGTIFARASSHGGDCAGIALHDAGYNLADDTTCGLNPAKHSRNNTATGLDPNGLQDNGGPTKTIALMPGSAAVDYIPVSAKPPVQDQRLFPRPDSGESLTDIGAFELQDG